MTPWFARLQSALDTEKYQPGYLRYPYRDRDIMKLDPALRWRLGKQDGQYTSGTCGHHATWLISGLVGDSQARIAATGMNLGDSWNHRSSKWADLKPRSSCTVALIAGIGLVSDSSGREYPVKGYADLFSHVSLTRMDQVVGIMQDSPGVAIVECPSHIEVALSIPVDAGITHPETGLPIQGVWQYSADGSRKTAGQRRTFRLWKDDEWGKAIHLWYLPAGAEIVDAIDWRVTVDQS